MDVLRSVIDGGMFPPGFVSTIEGRPGCSDDRVERVGQVLEEILKDDRLDRADGSAEGGWRDAFAEAFSFAWPGDAGALDVLAGRALGVVRAELASSAMLPELVEKRQRRIRRAARLWAGLGWQGDPWGEGCDALGRWQPGEAGGAKEIDGRVEAWLRQALPEKGDPHEALLRAVFARLAVIESCGRSSDQVLFPVALVSKGHAEEGRILRARMTLLEGVPAASLPRVVLAPWSPLLLDRRAPIDWLAVLRRGLEQLAGSADERLREEFRQARFLLELSPLPSPNAGPRPEVHQPPGLLVNGDSLGLAVVLAAWAASRRLALQPLIVTGAIAADRVGPVDGIPAKLWAVQEHVATEQGRPCSFLVPRDGPPVNPRSGEEPHPSITVREIGSWIELFDQEQTLLSDGFQRYRERIAVDHRGEWALSPSADPDAAGRDALLGEEVHAFRESAQAAYDCLLRREKTGPAARVCVPFDSEPARVARFLVAELLERLHENRAGHNPAHLPAPLLLPLLSPGDPKRTAEEQVLEWLRQGLLEWAGGEDLVARRSLENAVRGWPDKLLLVVYSARSREVDHDREEEKLRILRDYLGRLVGAGPARRAGLLLVASDVHHEGLLEEALGLASGE
jgi:hypothetical protein